MDLHLHAARLQNQPGPGARALVAEVAAAIENTGDERRRPEDDGVDANRGDEIEDRPPPVPRLHFAFGIARAWTTGAGADAIGAGAPGASMKRPKIIFPAVVCSTLVTTMSMFLLIIRRALSTTTIVPSSR